MRSAQARRVARAESKRRQRERAEQRAAERQRARARVGRFQVDDLLAQLVELDAFGGPRGKLAFKPPTLVIRRASRRPNQWGSFCTDRGQIQLTVWPGEADERAAAALLWLLTSFYRATYEDNGGGFGRQSWLMCAAAKEAWPHETTQLRPAMHVGRLSVLIGAALNDVAGSTGEPTAVDSAARAQAPAPRPAGGPGAAHPLAGRRSAGRVRQQLLGDVIAQGRRAYRRRLDLTALAAALFAAAEGERARSGPWHEAENRAWAVYSREHTNEISLRVRACEAAPRPAAAFELLGYLPSSPAGALVRLAGDGTLARVGVTLGAGGTLELLG